MLQSILLPGVGSTMSLSLLLMDRLGDLHFKVVLLKYHINKIHLVDIFRSPGVQMYLVEFLVHKNM